MEEKKVKKAVLKILTSGYQIKEEVYNILNSKKETELNQVVEDLLNFVKNLDPQPLFIDEKMLHSATLKEKKQIIQKPSVTNIKKALASEYDSKPEILFDPSELIGSTGSIEDFNAYFINRFNKISKILRERLDVRDCRPLADAVNATKDKPVKSIVITYDKREKGGNIFLRVEDLETDAVVLVPNNNRTLYLKAQRLSLDQIIALELIQGKRDLLIAKDIIFPGIPERAISKTDNPLAVLLISDLHCGSKTFLYKDFENLVKWIKGDLGNSKQRKKAESIKYLIITGDLVEGIGVYPNQEKELAISNLYKQYKEMMNYLQMIPDHINIIVIPGNHDAVRQALPQPAIPKDFLEPLCERDNVTSLGNPSWIKIENRNFLLYHGTSIIDIISRVPGLTVEKPEKALKYTMETRHLASLFGGSTPIAPETEDNLVIEKAPDVMQSGHIHVAGYENYRGSLLVSCAAWQSQTEYQRNLGLTPTVSKAFYLNLGTLDINILDFGAE